MEPSGFDEANTMLGPPEGVSEDTVQTLRVWRGVLSTGAPGVISCWKPTPEEVVEIQRTGRVWLMVWGTTAPPVVLLGQSLFKKQS